MFLISDVRGMSAKAWKIHFELKTDLHEALKFLINDRYDIFRTTEFELRSHAPLVYARKFFGPKKLRNQKLGDRKRCFWQKSKRLELKDTWNRSNIS